jgi:UDP-GlcNAc3NAcA epimerase
MMRNFNIRPPKDWHLMIPVDYLTMLGLQKNAKMVITDSGGVQRESKWLGIECKVFREQTEWAEIDEGQIESPSNYIIDALEGGV